MLSELYIKNLAVIDELSIKFGGGLNVLTGETGAGKSLIVGAIGAILGERFSTNAIRGKERIAVVEARFTLDEEQRERIAAAIADQDVEVSDEFVVRREISSTGRSRVFICDQSVGVASLKSIAPYLAELHMQGEHQALGTERLQLELLDEFAGSGELRRKVQSYYRERATLLRELEELQERLREGAKNKDYIEFQLNEIDSVNPQPGEDDDLLAERHLLLNAEKIAKLSAELYSGIYEDDDSVVSRLNSLRKHLQTLSSFDPALSESADQFESAIATLADLADNIYRRAGGMEDGSGRLDAVETRLAELEKLKRKHGGSIDSIIADRNDLELALRGLEGGEDLQSQVRDKLEEVEGAYLEAARELSKARRIAAEKLVDSINRNLPSVSLSKARIVINISSPARHQSESAPSVQEGIDKTEWGANGIDKITLLFSANEGMEPRPLASVASGGELSRLFLVIHTVSQESMSRGTLSDTIVFDEIDVGIGGQVADEVGRKLSSIARKQQVLCITHQSQIAKYADSHYLVAKRSVSGETRVKVNLLSRDERVKEIARMIAADENEVTAKRTAEWLIKEARNKARA